MVIICNVCVDEVDVLVVIGFWVWDLLFEGWGDVFDICESVYCFFEIFICNYWFFIDFVEWVGQIVGWGVWEKFDNIIIDFWVDFVFQCQGVGVVLFKYLEEEIVVYGYEMVLMQVYLENFVVFVFF